MAISSALSLAEKIEGVLTAIETGQAFTDSNTALEVTAALAQIADLGTYTRLDGSIGSTGLISNLVDVNLASADMENYV